MGKESKVKSKGSKKGLQVSDVWSVHGKLWYSENIIDKIIKLCKKTKKACETTPVKNLLADDILKILDYKDGKGD